MREQKFSLLLVCTLFLFVLPVHAQVHGVPASVTSFGFGGNISPAPGVPASVTSLGPSGFNFVPPVNGRCCFNTFFPGHQFSSLPDDQFRSRFSFRSLHRHNHFGPIFVPAYSVPYPYPVAVPYALGDDQEDEDYASDNSMFERRPGRSLRSPQGQQDVGDARLAPPSQAVGAASNSVAAQPDTVLIFKDGHKLDVENYAIVGETLFEFANGFTHKIQLADLDLSATQKANEDRGVEFQAPSLGAQ
jgi:hypothetical protein